jgi:hypothetical protein
MILLCLKEKISPRLVPTFDTDIRELITKGYVLHDKAAKKVSLTQSGLESVESLESYFTKSKKKTSVNLMGNDFLKRIEEYRAIFPAGKLPSGKPARQNAKALEDSFRWFFDTYDYTWDQVIEATKLYVNEYKDKDYLYMMTSQYFISKQDKNKIKHSELADYCDMVKDGFKEEVKTFNEKVV